MNDRLHHKALRYGLVGILGTFSHLGVLTALVERGQLDPVLASTLGFIVALLVSYGLNHRWTFRSSHGHRTALPRYIAVSLTGLGLNTGLMYVTVHILGWWYLAGQMTVIAIVPITNFILNFYWAFGRPNQDAEQGS